MSNEETRVTVIPDCQVCEGDKHPAVYDAAMPSGPWAYVCEVAFKKFRLRVGLGYGQRLVLIESESKTWLDNYPDQDKVKKAVDHFVEHGVGTRAAQYAEGDHRFGYWLALVDKRVGSYIPLSVFDLSDYALRDAYDSGMSPKQAAQAAIANDDTFSELIGEEGFQHE